MNIIDSWINDYYLSNDTVEMIRETVLAKPIIRYVVLDNFFKQDKLDKLIAHHEKLEFSEAYDRIIPNHDTLPYDSAVCFAKKGVHYGSELFYDHEWHRYCCYLTGTNINGGIDTEIKLRYHRPYSDGFWIHTDSTLRSMVAIAYFNKNWRCSDGGLLQLWKINESTDQSVICINHPSGRMDFLAKYKRIRTSTPGGGFDDGLEHDLTLIDQIVPSYNRIFLCNLKHSATYHSITPSMNRARLGFVQWLFEKRE